MFNFFIVFIGVLQAGLIFYLDINGLDISIKYICQIIMYLINSFMMLVILKRWNFK